MDICLKGICKSYGSHTVIKEFDCTFPQGSITAVMAPSGRGKTTLLRLILGLEAPDSGQITGVPEKKAVLFQEDRLFPELTVEGNLRAVLERKHERQEIPEILQALCLSECRKQKASSLSGGQARRTALARALLYPGELLILDEPFNGLDEAARIRTAQTIVQYRRGRTLIFVTHRTEDAELLQADRILPI